MKQNEKFLIVETTGISKLLRALKQYFLGY